MLRKHRHLAVVLLAAVVATPAFAQTDEPPDVLFIAVDDLNDWVGYLGGHPQTKTPNIDRLAARGMAFMNAHSPSALCHPARTALMSGLRPSTTGIYGNAPDWRGLEPFREISTLPRHFRENGYRTLGAGKLFHAHTFTPGATAGFNDLTAWDAYYPALDIQLPDELGPIRKPANGNPITDGFDWTGLVAEDSALADGQTTDWIERQLLAETGSPRFVAAGIFRPHLPWYVPREYFDLHPLAEIVLPEVEPQDLDDVPAAGARSAFSQVELHEWVLETGVWAEGVQAYLASVSFADAMVGKLLDALDASGRAGRTIVVLWGDHGFHLGEKGRWRKMTLWHESTHVPLIVVAPGVTTPGSRSSEPVSLMDLYPTLAELAGLAVPRHVEGRSLVPLLTEPSRDWPYPALVTYGYDNHAVVSDRYRYIRYADGSEELYDFVDDPNEWTNLAGRPDLERVKRELARTLPRENAEDLAPPPERSE